MSRLVHSPLWANTEQIKTPPAFTGVLAIEADSDPIFQRSLKDHSAANDVGDFVPFSLLGRQIGVDEMQNATHGYCYGAKRSSPAWRGNRREGIIAVLSMAKDKIR